MKKLLVIPAFTIVIAFAGCSGNNTESTNESTATPGTSAADSTPPPDGVINSNAISTDTAAMNTSRMEQKKDSAERQQR